MSVAIRAEADGERTRLVPAGTFDLAHASAVVRAVEQAERDLIASGDVDLHLSALERIDGSGAVLLARLIDRLEARGLRTRLIEDHNPHAVRLITLYRERRAEARPQPTRRMGPLAQLGFVAAAMPGMVTGALDFLGQAAAAVPKAFVSPRSVDWSSLPRLMQAIGADALPVTSAANLLVGVIIGFLGVSQLGRFGAVVYVPELVVIAQFRELGPLVTAIVVAGRSGAGLASELATMQVSEEIDALRSMGFNPVSWLVVPRCLALVATVPLLTWIGDVLALGGGLLATIAITDMTPRAYVLGTAGPHHRRALPQRDDQDALPRADHRAHRLQAGSGRARRSSGRRGAHHHRRRDGHLRRDRDQRALHAVLHAAGNLNMPPSRPHIVVEDLRIGWGARVLMEHVSFEVERGTTLAILGGSGSGKSTLLRYLIGLEQPMAGRIDIDGVGEPHVYSGVPPFGVLFQSGALFSSLTLAENLALPLTTWTSVRGPLVQDFVQAKLDLVGLGAFAGHLPGEISGGMKKRAGIARAMMIEPDLLFFDEPSAGLDPISAVELDHLIVTLSRDLGITIVIVTHELPSIFLVADNCIVLDKEAKGIVARGDPRRLRDESAIPFVHNFFTRSSPSASAARER